MNRIAQKLTRSIKNCLPQKEDERCSSVSQSQIHHRSRKPNLLLEETEIELHLTREKLVGNKLQQEPSESFESSVRSVMFSRQVNLKIDKGDENSNVSAFSNLGLNTDDIAMTAEQKWRSEIIRIFLRINGKTFPEAFNRMIDIDLNLALYLVKFLKMTPQRASRAVFFREYRLFSQEN